MKNKAEQFFLEKEKKYYNSFILDDFKKIMWGKMGSLKKKNNKIKSNFFFSKNSFLV